MKLPDDTLQILLNTKRFTTDRIAWLMERTLRSANFKVDVFVDHESMRFDFLVFDFTEMFRKFPDNHKLTPKFFIYSLTDSFSGKLEKKRLYQPNEVKKIIIDNVVALQKLLSNYVAHLFDESF